VVFVRPPSREDYGMVAVFEDLYGNKFDLMEPMGDGDSGGVVFEVPKG
jgi:hypothetical protein